MSQPTGAEGERMGVRRTDDEIVVLAREAAAVLRGFYDDVTPCLHSLKAGYRCAMCGRARSLLIECDGIVSEATDG